MTVTSYPLGDSARESARLRSQSEQLRPQAVALLERIGVRPGQHAIDLGQDAKVIAGVKRHWVITEGQQAVAIGTARRIGNWRSTFRWAATSASMVSKPVPMARNTL